MNVLKSQNNMWVEDGSLRRVQNHYTPLTQLDSTRQEGKIPYWLEFSYEKQKFKLCF